MKKREPEINWKERAVKADSDLQQVRSELTAVTNQRNAATAHCNDALKRLADYDGATSRIRALIAILLIAVTGYVAILCWWYAPKCLEHQISAPYPVVIDKPCTLVMNDKQLSDTVDKDEKLITRLKRRVRHLEQSQ